MLPRKNRLPVRSIIKSMFKTGQWRQGRVWRLLTAQSNSIFPRLALIIPKKIITKSVTRHRIKRIVLENIRVQFLPKLPQNTDYLFILKKEAKNCSESELLKDVQFLCQ